MSAAYLIADLPGSSSHSLSDHRPWAYSGNLFVVLPDLDGDQYGIYRSTDSGATWAAMQTFAGGASTGAFRTLVSGSTLYVAYVNGSNFLAVAEYNMATDSLAQYASAVALAGSEVWIEAARRSDASLVIGYNASSGPVTPRYVVYSGSGSFSGATTITATGLHFNGMCVGAGDRVHMFFNQPFPSYGWYHDSLDSGGGLAGITSIASGTANHATTSAVILDSGGSRYPVIVWKEFAPNRSAHGLSAATPTWTVQGVTWNGAGFALVEALVEAGSSVTALGFDGFDQSRIMTGTLDAAGAWSASTTLFHDGAINYDTLRGNLLGGQLGVVARSTNNLYWYICEAGDGTTITVPSIGPGVVVGDPSLGGNADILVPSIDPTLGFGVPVLNGATQYAARYRAF